MASIFACLQSMKTPSKQRSRNSEARSLSKNPVWIRVIKAQERKRFEALMGAYHYLGEGHSAGDTMRMVAELDGKWAGLLMWGSACYRLKPRDEFIGWTPTQRARRQKLVVQNRRFLLLADRGEQPNLASHILGAAIRELPGFCLCISLKSSHCTRRFQRFLIHGNRSFRIGAVLSIMAMAIFSGHTNLVQIVRFANRLRNDQRKEPRCAAINGQ